MDLYTPHMEMCDDPPRPSVAAVRTPSVATKVLLALLLLARIRSAHAESSEYSRFLSPVSGLRVPKWLDSLPIYEFTE